MLKNKQSLEKQFRILSLLPQAAAQAARAHKKTPTFRSSFKPYH
jgi:hypothetical protein